MAGTYLSGNVSKNFLIVTVSENVEQLNKYVESLYDKNVGKIH